MSLEMQTYVEGVEDSIIPRWLERINSLGIRCEIYPDFSFKSHSGFLPFRISLENVAHPHLVGVELLTGFEFYINEFDLGKEIEILMPKIASFDKTALKQPEPVYFASSEIDPILLPCKKVLSFIWGISDTFGFRMATLSSAVLAEITNGVCTYPADNIWYSNKNLVENTLRDVVDYENSLDFSQLKVHRFEKWL